MTISGSTPRANASLNVAETHATEARGREPTTGCLGSCGMQDAWHPAACHAIRGVGFLISDVLRKAPGYNIHGLDLSMLITLVHTNDKKRFQIAIQDIPDHSSGTQGSAARGAASAGGRPGWRRLGLREPRPNPFGMAAGGR